MFVEVLSSRQPFARFAGAPPKLSPRVPSDLGLTGSASTPWNKAATACKKSPKSAKLKRSGSRFWFVCLPCCFFADEHHIEPSTLARKPKFLAISHDLLALIAKILHGVHEQRKVCFSVAGHFVIYCVHVFKQNQRRSVTLAITEHASKGLRRGSSAAFLRQNQFAFVYGAVGSGQVLAARSYKQAINRRNWALLSM